MKNYLVILTLSALIYFCHCQNPPKCATNQTYYQCTPCKKLCASGNFQRQNCTKTCTPGCDCASGYYNQDGKCIAKKDCCELNPLKTYVNKPRQYQEICDKNGNIIKSTKTPKTSGCYCKKGYVSKGNDCIARSDCKQPCVGGKK